MASYVQKFLTISSWMMNPDNQDPTPTTPRANPNSSPRTKTRKLSSPLNMMTQQPPAIAEMRTQVYVTPKSNHIAVAAAHTTTATTATATTATTTIETQTIPNPELLLYTNEELVGHYTSEIFQCEPAPAISLEEQTCCVCLDTLTLGNKNTTITPCGHTYHLSCLLSSLRNKNLCPMCRGSLEDPRPKPSTTNTLRPSNAEQIIRDELYWFPKSAHILNIRGSNHPKRAFKDSLRTFAYAVLQTTAEFVHADNIPEEWYSDDDDDDDSDDNTENNDNSENTDNEQTDNEQTDDEQTDGDNYENNTENEETDNQDNQDNRDQHVQQIHIDEAHVNRTRGVNPNTRMNVRLRSSSRRSDFDLRHELP